MRPLTLNEAGILSAGTQLIGLLQRLERSSPTRAVVPHVDRSALSDLLGAPFPHEGIGIEQLFSDIAQTVIPNSTNTSHPRFLAYVLGTPNGIAPFADAIAAALNQNCNFWQLSPAANAIEQRVISWFAAFFDYPGSSGGLMTSGGSMATLTAISTAMHARAPGMRHDGLQARSSTLVLYASEEAHHCVEKSAAILGLGTANVRTIAADSAFRMRVDELRAAVERDAREGREPFCVVATAGTINTGAIDPIAEVADLCAHQGLWLHVDAAYGGFFALSNRIRGQLLSCARADSIALDPHKLLFAPLEAGCLLVRDRRSLERAFRYESPYLPRDDDPLFTTFMNHGPELSRSFKAFKIWCALRACGVDAFVDAIEHSLEIARYFEQRLVEAGRFEMMAPVPLTAVCFRIKGRDDAFHERVMAQLRDEGTALLGPVRCRGRQAIRACVANFRTRTPDIDLIVERLTTLAK